MLRQRIGKGLVLGILGLLPAGLWAQAPAMKGAAGGKAVPKGANISRASYIGLPPPCNGFGGGAGCNPSPGCFNPYGSYPYWTGYGYGGGYSSFTVIQSPTFVVQPPAGYGSAAPPAGNDPARLPPPTLGPAPDPNVAYIDLNLPEAAELWVQGVKMSQTGPRRQFVTPTLSPGYDYSYELRIAYKENGKEVTVIRHISVRAGDRKGLTIIAQPAEIAAAK